MIRSKKVNTPIPICQGYKVSKLAMMAVSKKRINLKIRSFYMEITKVFFESEAALELGSVRP